MIIGKILIGCVVAIALISQCDFVKNFFDDVNKTIEADAKMVDLYENAEPKKQWNKQKCEDMHKVLNNFCSGICNKVSTEMTWRDDDNCVAECETDFEEHINPCKSIVQKTPSGDTH